MTKLIPYIKRNIIPIIGLFAGFGAGYLYWLLIGCNTGTCPITSVWYRSALYGALMGWLVAGLFKKRRVETKINIKTTNSCALKNPLHGIVNSLPGVYGVEADMFSGVIKFNHTNEVSPTEIEEAVRSAGYEIIKDSFAEIANEWDTPQRVKMVKDFVNEIRSHIRFSGEDIILDLGCGTGLVGLELLDEVKFCNFVDTSDSMLDALESKLSYAQLERSAILKGSLLDYTGSEIDKIIAHNSVHHIEDINALIERAKRTLKPGGVFIVADILEEDGSFHYPEVVPHNGFNTTKLANLFESIGFKILTNRIYGKQIKKDKEYQKFIIIAKNIEL